VAALTPALGSVPSAAMPRERSVACCACALPAGWDSACTTPDPARRPRKARRRGHRLNRRFRGCSTQAESRIGGWANPLFAASARCHVHGTADKKTTFAIEGAEVKGYIAISGSAALRAHAP
jgi:hypothetical protein